MTIGSGTLFAGELTGIRLASNSDTTRIVLDLDRAVEHRLFQLADPDRLVIDLPRTAAGSNLQLPVPKGRVRSVRTGSRPGGELRVVLDLTAPVESTSFPLGPDGGSGHRLVVDLSDARPGARQAQAPVVRDEYTGRDLVVVVDAGHGGHDPGTSGHGIDEKDVVLQIARRLASLVDEQPGFRSVLVRNDDHYVDYDDRLAIARQARADFFISIHADWVADPSVRGATVYSISTRRATSERARIVADRENAADLIGGVTISDKDDLLAQVLIDLSQEKAINLSNMAGERLIEQLSRVTTLRKRTVEQKSLVVLTSPDIPSLLVETAYLSNASDAANLRDAGFQNLLARGLLAGILEHFRDYSPPDSYVARNPPPRQLAPIRHVIARGETLSEIAERYRISLRALRQSNQINGDIIRIGQVLTIPTTG